MKKILIALIVVLLSISNVVLATEINDELEQENIVAHTVKYYKTVTNLQFGSLNSMYNLNNMPGVNNSSVTYEITEEEYNNESPNLVNDYVETTYKRMDTYIESVDSGYRYKVTLHWKNMPVVRSYDIIGIGYASSVRGNSPYFQYDYCRGANDCYSSSYASSSYVGNNGVGVVFYLMSGTVTKMDVLMEFYVSKNTNATIVSQTAYGDYAHATTSVSLNNAANYYVNSGGIRHDASMVSSYDDIPTADAVWTGSW